MKWRSTVSTPNHKKGRKGADFYESVFPYGPSPKVNDEIEGFNDEIKRFNDEKGVFIDETTKFSKIGTPLQLLKRHLRPSVFTGILFCYNP